MSRKSSFVLIVLAFAGFISLGLPDGLLGVAWPSIRGTFRLPIDALGSLLVAYTVGYLLSSFSSGKLLERISVGTLLALSCLATAGSLLGYALAPAWWVVVALGAVAGLGAGAIDAGANTFAASHFSPRMVNWLHASYGIGAAGGPLIMSTVQAMSQPWQLGYAVVAGGQLLLAVCFGISRKQWPEKHAASRPEASAAGRRASARSTLRLPAMRLSLALFFVYTGLEAAAGLWSFSLFREARGISASVAGSWVSLYWVSLMLGRLFSGLIVSRIAVNHLLRRSIVGLIAGSALVWLGPSRWGFLGLVVMGLAAAPVFPSLIATTPERLGTAHTGNGVGFQIAAAVLGQSLVPAGIGVVAGRINLEMIGPCLLGTAVAVWLLFEALTTAATKRVEESRALA